MCARASRLLTAEDEQVRAQLLSQANQGLKAGSSQQGGATPFAYGMGDVYA